jgi:pimeloyl-ACP methyl ester carboxylesterase
MKRSKASLPWLISGLALLLALFIGPYLIPVRPLEDTVSPDDLADPDSRFIEVDNVRIHYKQFGTKEPAIVLLHGFGASSYSWRNVLHPLSELGATLAYDRPGFGLTERPTAKKWQTINPYSLDSQAKLLIDLLDRLGIREAYLIGNSMGGVVAVHAALTYPERVKALILVDAALYLADSIPRWAQTLARLPQIDRLGPLFARRIAKVGGERLLVSSWHDKNKLTEDVWDGYMRVMKTENWDYGLWQILRSRHKLNLTNRLHEINVPTLIVTGDDDGVVPTIHSLRLAENIPNAQLAVIPDCGHLPQEERPDEFLKVVREFLDQLQPQEPWQGSSMAAPVNSKSG